MLTFAAELARQAGAVLLEGLTNRPAVELKSSFEVVTEVDRASEKLIVEAIRAYAPDHAILAEEGSGIEQDSEYLWLIDPLDGTNNYAHSFRYFSASIALLHKGELYLGIVYDPTRDELFTAERGRGAYCNNRRIHVSNIESLGASLVSTGFSYNYANVASNNLPEFDRIQSRSHGVRRAGSAAMDLAYVAIGRLEAHWEYRLQAWDSAAGATLVLEAGGTLTTLEGQKWTPWSNTIVASNTNIHNELMNALQGE